MPVAESAIIVARFLKANHYEEPAKTLSAFIREAGLPEDIGDLKVGAWTIEQLIQEKKQFDASLSYEKQSTDVTSGWNKTAPSQPVEPELPITSNVLCVFGDEQQNTIAVACADRTHRYVEGTSPFADANTGGSAGSHLSESPVLSVQTAGDFVLSTAMSGHLTLRDRKSHGIIDEVRHHSKYAVQVVSFISEELWVVATAGWDQKIFFYLPDRSKASLSTTSSRATGMIGEPVHVQRLPTNPESLVFARHPDTHDLYLVVSRRDSTHLYYFRITNTDTGSLSVEESGRQNLAPHSNAWVAFTPCSLALCPTDPTLLAVATSHLPHMKLITVRLLFPGSSLHALEQQGNTQAAVARAELARQDREDAAIQLHVTTMAPQTPYSTPQVVWRPDASGLFVNGDDGVIRGIESSTGKVISLLQGHETGSKVRTLWAGHMKKSGVDTSEVLVSGGFDKKFLVWTV